MSRKDKNTECMRVAAQNRRARFDYFIKETFEAGLMLEGTEVKSLRAGRANIQESYAAPANGALMLYNAYIPGYQAGAAFTHEERRARRLLMHRREIDRLGDQVARKGASLVPLRIYFNDRGYAKLELALAVGKKKQDKREAVKERDWKREQSRLLRARD